MGTDPTPRRVRFLTKPGCHLCDVARPVLIGVLSELSLAFDEVDITTDDALYARYWTDIPVVLVDGEVVAIHHVDPTRLTAALDKSPHTG
jgi:predicted thioredoxin/glutaredoxin